MRKPALTVEWQIAQSDADWARLQEPTLPESEPVASHLRPLLRSCWRVAALLLLMASGDDWWWRPEHTALPPPAASVTAQSELAVVAQPDDRLATGSSADHNSKAWWGQHGRKVSGLRAAVQTADPKAHPDIELHTVEFEGEQAVVSIVTSAEGRAPAYRQTRFYRRIGPDWRQTAPEAAFWGPERSWETTFFVFHFRQHDAPAVIAVAPQVDALYTTMQRNFGLPIIPTSEKLVIEVNVTHPPDHPSSWFVVPDHLIVPSPAVYWAPVELTDTKLLAQSITLPLLEHVLAQASKHAAIRASWQPLLDALRLWQVWDSGLALSAWREEVVQWIYGDLPAINPEQALPLPAHYTALCVAHKLWMPSPTHLNIPLLCANLDREIAYFSLWSTRTEFVK